MIVEIGEPEVTMAGKTRVLNTPVTIDGHRYSDTYLMDPSNVDAQHYYTNSVAELVRLLVLKHLRSKS